MEERKAFAEGAAVNASNAARVQNALKAEEAHRIDVRRQAAEQEVHIGFFQDLPGDVQAESDLAMRLHQALMTSIGREDAAAAQKAGERAAAASSGPDPASMKVGRSVLSSLRASSAAPAAAAPQRGEGLSK